MKRIFLIVVGLAMVGLGVCWYVQWSRVRALNSGDVFVREQPEEGAKPEAPASASTPPAAGSDQPAQPARGAAAALEVGSAARQVQLKPKGSAVAAPAAETLPRNPPNGVIFAGTGKYQLYRQGDITWRLNTDTGWACVLLATDAQWSKLRVWERGCRNS
jgi:hypothetical protein